MRARTIALSLSLLLSFMACGASFSFAETPEATPSSPVTPDDLPLIAVDTVTEVTRANVIKLASGKSYALDEIRIPFAYESTTIDLLKKGLLNKKVGLYSDKPQDSEAALDRLGFPLVHVLKEDGTWVQAELVAAGLAWVSGSANSRSLLTPLYRREITARAEKLGLWADPKYDIKTARTIADYLNSFQIYEGTLTSYASGKGGLPTYFLDSGKNGKDAPFAFRLDNPKIKGMNDPAAAIKRWRQKKIRVRGWVEKENQIPTIAITHPEQLEILEPSPN